jgi:hypothetical protein
MPLNIESGYKNFRIEYVAETTTGVAPVNPAYALFSDGVESFGGAEIARASVTGLRFLGDADVDSFILGAEDSVVPIRYALHDRALTADILNASIVRDADNNMSSSFTIVAREERTLSVGIDSAGSRTYTVSKGAFATDYVLAGELDPATPLLATATFTAEKTRSYQIDQPTSATQLLGINSTSTADTTQSVRIEDDGTPAATDQTAALSGTSNVSMGALTYDQVDSVSLDASCEGDVEVWLNTGSDATPVKGAVICTIRGSDYYGSGEGDLGVPPLGTGSHGAAIGGTPKFATLADSAVTWGAAALADVAVSRVQLSTSNMEGGQLLPTLGTRRKKILVGGTGYTVTAQMVGTFASHDNIDDHLGGTSGAFVWAIGDAAANKTMTLSGAIKTSPAGRIYEREGAMVLDVEFMGTSLAIS